MKFSDFIYFYPENPMLIHRDQQLLDHLSNDPNAVAELKPNGSRCEIHLINGNASYWTRHGTEFKYENFDYDMMTEELLKRFPERGYYLFDSEMRHNKVVGVKNQIMIFDCFIYNDLFLNRHDFQTRRSVLESHFMNPDLSNEYLSLAQQWKTGFRELFESLEGDPEIEGIVIKLLTGMFDLGRVSGRESKWMYKARYETGRHKF